VPDALLRKAIALSVTMVVGGLLVAYWSITAGEKVVEWVLTRESD
jgi:hypothetical protein